MKTMSPICNKKEWTTYVGVMMKLEICGIELVATMVAQNNVGDESSQSPTLPEAVDEQDIDCGVMLTQPSQETQDDIDADDPPFVASNETIWNVEPVSTSVGVGDVVADVGFISGVDPQPTAIGSALDVDPPFVEPKFMLEYKATFGDERVEDLAGD
jgi:hypothetical protein